MNTEDGEGKVGGEEEAEPRVQRTLSRVHRPTLRLPWSQRLPSCPAEGGRQSLPGGREERTCIYVEVLLVHRGLCGGMLCLKPVAWPEPSRELEKCPSSPR